MHKNPVSGIEVHSIGINLVTLTVIRISTKRTYAMTKWGERFLSVWAGVNGPAQQDKVTRAFTAHILQSGG